MLRWLDTVESFRDEIIDIYISLDFDMTDIENEIVCEANYRFDTLNAFFGLIYRFWRDFNFWNYEPEQQNCESEDFIANSRISDSLCNNTL